MVRGGARVTPCSGAEQCEGLMELDQVDASGRRWRKFCTCGQEYHVNMSVLEPYLQVLSHGGQEGSGLPSFCSCSRPQTSSRLGTDQRWRNVSQLESGGKGLSVHSGSGLKISLDLWW